MVNRKLATFRIDGAYLQLLRSVVRARGVSLSAFTRRAIMVELGRLSYLPPDTKKALGITDNAIGRSTGGGNST